MAKRLNKKDVQELNNAVRDLTKAIKEFGTASDDSMKPTLKKFKDYEKAVENVSDDFDDLADNVKKLSIEKGLDIRHVWKYEKKLSDLNDELKKLRKQSRDATTDQEFENVKKSTENFRKKVNETTQEMEKLGASSYQAFMDMGGGIKHIGNLWGALSKGPGAVKDWSKSAQEYGEQLKGWPGRIGKAGKVMKMLGGTAKGLGKVLGGVGKILGGWPGLIMVGLKKLADFAMRVDSFVKEANQAFARVRGPDIMTGDVRKQFREFNNQIYKAGENIRVGLDVDEIRQFMESVYQAGQNITMLNTSLMSYRDVIFVASKASRTLAMDLDQVGAYMGELMTDFKMDLDSIDDLFVQVAFDADKSGLSTDRFWNAITNASASLSFFGTFLEESSKLMKNFTESQVMGAKETEEVVTDITQAFNKMSKESRMALATLLEKVDGAEKEFREMFEEEAEELGKKKVEVEGKVEFYTGHIKDLAVALKKAETEKKEEEIKSEIKEAREELKKARSESNAIQGQIREIEKAAEGDIYDMAVALPYLSGRAAEIIGMLGKLQGGFKDMGSKEILIMDKIFNVLELPPWSQKLKRLAQSQRDLMLRNLGVNEKQEDYSLSIIAELKETKELDKKQKKALTEGFKDVRDASSTEELEEAQQKLEKFFKENLGWSEEAAENAAKFVGTSENFGNILEGFIKNDTEIGKSQIDLLKNSLTTEENVVKSIFGTKEAEEETQDQLEDNARKTFKQITDETLTLEKMKKAIKDEAFYRGAMVTNLDRISHTVRGIYKLMPKYKEERETAAQKTARKNLERSLNLEEDALKETKEQDKHLIRIATAHKESNKRLEDLKSVEGILKDSETTENDIAKEIERLEKAGYDTNDELIKKLERAQTALKEDNEDEMSLLKYGIKKDIKEQEKVISGQGKNLRSLEQMRDENKELIGTIKEGNVTSTKQVELLRSFGGGFKLEQGSPEPETPVLPESQYMPPATTMPPTITRTERKQGLIEPMTIDVAAQPIIAHRGETLLPAPGAGGRGPGAGAAPGTGFTYNITAVSKDLVTAKEVGQIVVNQIRASRYNEQLTGTS